jgi:antitoxin (DNA-binding transcriptional repressor) of toxin-antitoxin stability system
MNNFVSLKEFRQDVEKYARRIAKGDALIVTKRSNPLFRIGPVNEGSWEEVIDFTKLKRGGVRIEELLARL